MYSLWDFDKNRMSMFARECKQIRSVPGYKKVGARWIKE